MIIESNKTDKLLIVTPMEKRIDAYSAKDFKGKMVDWINEGNFHILIDLVNVDFIDSSGLNAIVSSLKTIGKNGDLYLCSINETIMSMFRLTRLNRVFKMFDSKDKAVEALSS
ncbi:MAG: STAS domain-containing protein [Desulfobacterales bacterium]|nr:STAS domain-containing protein [Desulfobacterales bacterium]